MRAPSRGRGRTESDVRPIRGHAASQPAKAVKPLPLLGPQGVPLHRRGTSRGVTEEFHRCYCHTANADSAATARDATTIAHAATLAVLPGIQHTIAHAIEWFHI